MTRLLGISLQPTSLAGDVAVTQLVDGTMGVHVKIPKSIFK